MRTMLDSTCRNEMIRRIRSLTPDCPRRWGTMSAAQMVAHLTDQMHHTLGDSTPARIRSVLRWPLFHGFVLYCMPWPKGRVKGPPEAFITQPVNWASDIEALVALLERFAARAPESDWPQHAMFGRMSRKDWGRFCFRHFDHHLRQFGA